MDLDIVNLSRLQFAATALYHFLFVPLTLGLSVLLAVMETSTSAPATSCTSG